MIWRGGLVVAGVWLVALLSGCGETEDPVTRGEIEQQIDRARECEAAGVDPFAGLLPGLRYRDLSQAQLEAIIPQAGGLLRGAYEGRAVIKGRRLVARVIAARVGGSAAEQEDVEEGAQEGAERLGAELVRRPRVNGTEIDVYEGPNGVGVATFPSTCHFLIVYGAVPSDAQRIAVALSRKPDDIS